MTYIFRPSIKQHFLVLFPFLVVTPILIWGYIHFLGRYKLNPLIIGVVVFYFLSAMLPVIILHIQYSLANWRAVLTVDTASRTLSYIKGKRTIHIGFDDIEAIKYYATTGHISKKGSSGWYTFDPYRFYKIILKDNQKIYITCLMMNNIEHNFEQKTGFEAKWKFRGIAFLY